MEETTEEKETSLTATNPEVEWTVEHEQILIEWADKAMCYRWLHAKANSLYSHLNAWYTIPVIIISTLTGTANFAQQRVPLEYQNYFAMIVGAFNILGGIITTIQQFLKITQLNEAHRVSSIAWDKFYRNIKIELAKHPNERIHVTQMIKMSKEEFDRLMETSPTIPDNIIKSFKTSFKKNEEFEKIAKPEICDVMISTEAFLNPWNNDENKTKRLKDVKYALSLEEINKKHVDEIHVLSVSKFSQSFFQMNNRKPTDTEIIDNLQDEISIDILRNIIENQKLSNV
jgi:hypothetical protein